MTDDGSPSITRMIADLQHIEEDRRERAAMEIWNVYFQRLCGMASKHLSPRVKQRVDPEDVIQSVYKSFFVRQGKGQFDLANRDELWRLLAHITIQKSRNAAKREGRGKRDVRREQGQAKGPDGEIVNWVEQGLIDDEPTPEEAAIFTEEVELRLAQLPEAAREIASLKLQGYTNEEIAGSEMLDCSTRTVERKLAMIRKEWEASIADASSA